MADRERTEDLIQKAARLADSAGTYGSPTDRGTARGLGSIGLGLASIASAIESLSEAMARTASQQAHWPTATQRVGDDDGGAR